MTMGHMKTPRGRNELVLCLDFDGVPHHDNVLWHRRKGDYRQAPPGDVLFQRLGLPAFDRNLMVDLVLELDL